MPDGVWESSRPCNARCQDSSTGFSCLSAGGLQSPFNYSLGQPCAGGTNDLMNFFSVIRSFICRQAGGNLATHLLQWLSVSVQ